MVERAVYRWPDPDRKVDQLTFDPFASPWQPAKAAPAEPRAAQPAAAPKMASAAPPTGDFKSAVDAFERSLLESALERHRFNQRATAEGLGLSYDQLRHSLKRHGLI